MMNFIDWFIVALFILNSLLILILGAVYNQIIYLKRMVSLNDEIVGILNIEVNRMDIDVRNLKEELKK
jgi:hypothetical protein